MHSIFGITKAKSINLILSYMRTKYENIIHLKSQPASENADKCSENFPEGYFKIICSPINQKFIRFFCFTHNLTVIKVQTNKGKITKLIKACLNYAEKNNRASFMPINIAFLILCR